MDSFLRPVTIAEALQQRIWVASYVKPAPQNSVRAFCKWRAGQYPLNTFRPLTFDSVQPMDLDAKSVELKGNAGIALPERKGDLTYFGVKPGSEPKQLKGDNLFIVSVKVADVIDKHKNPLPGQWFTCSFREPLVFRRVRSGPVPRGDIVAEVPGVPYMDEEEAQPCFLIEPEDLALLLIAIRGEDQEGQPGESLDPLENDYSHLFGSSQQPQSQDPNPEREQRAATRSQQQEKSSSSKSSSNKSSSSKSSKVC